jgi:hypothetical protein
MCGALPLGDCRALTHAAPLHWTSPTDGRPESCFTYLRGAKVPLMAGVAAGSAVEFMRLNYRLRGSDKSLSSGISNAVARRTSVLRVGFRASRSMCAMTYMLTPDASPSFS